ncbi:MAG: ParA family protein [Bacteroidota bacterium]
MAQVISIANEKGGVAKTTTTAALGSILSHRGHRVIMIDLDPQADLTSGLNIDPEDRNIFDCVFNHKKMRATKVNDNLVLIGGSPKMKPALFEKASTEDKEYKLSPYGILRKRIKDVLDQTDFVLLDCPPNVDTVTMNALAASDYVLIPTEAHRYSINGAAEIVDLVDTLKEELTPGIEILGVLITRYRSSTAIHKQLAEELKETYKDLLFSNPIKENITLQEVSHEGREIVDYDEERQAQQLVKSKFVGIENYESIVEELLNRIK